MLNNQIKDKLLYSNELSLLDLNQYMELSKIASHHLQRIDPSDKRFKLIKYVVRGSILNSCV